MTKDFTRIGRTSQRATATAPNATDAAKARSQRVVVMAIWFAAGGFFLAGVWLVSGQTSPFPPDLSFLIGVAFIVSAVIDLIAVRFIKRAWATQSGQ